MCMSDSDCRTKIRSDYPLESAGPGLCDCYASSDRFTFDETEGQKNFRITRCSADACDRFEAYCPLAPGSRLADAWQSVPCDPLSQTNLGWVTFSTKILESTFIWQYKKYPIILKNCKWSPRDEHRKVFLEVFWCTEFPCQMVVSKQNTLPLFCASEGCSRR